MRDRDWLATAWAGNSLYSRKRKIRGKWLIQTGLGRLGRVMVFVGALISSTFCDIDFRGKAG